MKSLSEILNEIEFDPCDYESKRTFNDLKQVAIELAKQMEIISGKHKEFCVDDIEDAMFSADECLSRAKEIIGGE